MIDSIPLSPSPMAAPAIAPAVTEAEWRPGRAGDALPHGEIFAPGREGGGAGLALALALDRLRGRPVDADAPTDVRPDARADLLADAPDERAWLWVQDVAAIRLGGRPYGPGLPAALRHRLIHVAAKSPEDALFALEEGLRCRELAFVVGEIAGNPRALDFTASRRLSLAVERHGVPLWLVRLDARHDLGSARLRWDVRSAVSPPPRWNPQAPGAASWRAELFRARNHPPGEWILRDDEDTLVAARPVAHPADTPAFGNPAPHPGDLAAAAGDRPLAAG